MTKQSHSVRKPGDCHAPTAVGARNDKFLQSQIMHITSAVFVKGVRGTDPILAGNKPYIAFIGRSNVGKSSVINSLVKQKNLARASVSPGRTREINLFLINNSFYLVDLPGYGFAKASREVQIHIQQLIYWYLLNSEYEQKKVVLIIDANVGLTDNDLKMLYSLGEKKKSIVIVANKVDKIKASEYEGQLQKIREAVHGHVVIPYSAKKGTGVGALVKEIVQR